MISLEDLGRQGNEMQLKQAIAYHDLPEIVKRLREMDRPLPVEIVQALADCIDPDRPAMKPGGKPRPDREAHRRWVIVTEYKALCGDPEWARFIINFDKEEFQIVDDSNPHDKEGRFFPCWKSPDMNRRREQTPLPAAGDIRDFICKWHRISTRTFDKMLSEHNRGKSSKR